MPNKSKKEIAKEIFDNMEISCEQYNAFVGIATDLDLDIPVKEPTWDELLDG